MKKIVLMLMLLQSVSIIYPSSDEVSQLTEEFKDAAENGNEEIVQKIMQNKRFNEIDSWDLWSEFNKAVEKGDDKIAKMIIQNQRFDEISLYGLMLTFNKAVEKGDDKIVEMIMQNKRFDEIDANNLGHVFDKAVEKGDDKIVEMIMQNKRFDEIDPYSLGLTLNKAVTKGDEKIVKMIMQNKRFNEIPGGSLYFSINSAVKQRDEKMVKLLLQSDRVSRQVGPDFIEIAVKNKEGNIAHLLKAYSALKSEEELKDLSYVDAQFYKAYKRFLSGDANDLRNLIFPVGKKGSSYIYAVYPRENAESSAINLISKSLVKLFRPDYIRSLIITLVETNAQKESARELLELMGISKKADIAATKIQSAYKGYKTRKNLAAERQQELEEQEKIKPSSQEHLSMAREERF